MQITITAKSVYEADGIHRHHCAISLIRTITFPLSPTRPAPAGLFLPEPFAGLIDVQA